MAGASAAAMLKSAWAGVPPGACDCHVHIVGPQATYPMVADRTYTPPRALAADLRAFHDRLGIQRSVLIQPSFYGTDNRCLLDALAELGDTARGVAVVAPDIAHEDLVDLDRRGVRGVRINLETGGHRDPKEAAADLVALAGRLARLDWHIQVYAALPVIAAAADTIARLPVPVVIDHYGLPVAAKGTSQPGFAALLDLARERRVYVKLSAPYRISTVADHADAEPFARALIDAAPGQMLWASDWPHTDRVPGRAATEIHPYRTIDDRGVLGRFEAWCPDAEKRRRILVETPARLYRFP